MWLLKVLSVMPFLLGAGIFAQGQFVPAHPYVQYGALGLCAIVVIFLCKHLTCITTEHRQERKALVLQLKSGESDKVDLLTKLIAAQNRIAQALEDRPCLRGDQRINEDG